MEVQVQYKLGGSQAQQQSHQPRQLARHKNEESFVPRDFVELEHVHRERSEPAQSG